MESLPVKIFSFSGLQEIGTALKEQVMRMEEKGRSIAKILSVNNFLKSQDEIDADFYLDRKSSLVYEELNNRDGYLNTNNPRRIDSGFMEENY